MSQIRKILLEDVPHLGRRSFPKTGAFRRSASSAEWALINEILQRIKLDTIPQSGSLVPSPRSEVPVSESSEILTFPLVAGQPSGHCGSRSLPVVPLSKYSPWSLCDDHPKLCSGLADCELDDDGYPTIFNSKRIAPPLSRASSIETIGYSDGVMTPEVSRRVQSPKTEEKEHAAVALGGCIVPHITQQTKALMHCRM